MRIKGKNLAGPDKKSPKMLGFKKRRIMMFQPDFTVEMSLPQYQIGKFSQRSSRDPVGIDDMISPVVFSDQTCELSSQK